MPDKHLLNDNDFKELIKNAPLISIDLILKNKNREVLLGFRKNSPAKNKWFVPGGRIQKGEFRQEAFKRITTDELNQEIDIKDATFLKVTEHHYSDNTYEIEGFGTHYVVLIYTIVFFTFLPTLIISYYHNTHIFSK